MSNLKNNWPGNYMHTIRLVRLLLFAAKMRIITFTNLSYSRPNSSWPIFGASGSTSNMDESDAMLSHDMARCKPAVGS